MSKHTLTIELARPLEWVRVKKEEDSKALREGEVYAIRKDGQVWMARLEREHMQCGLKDFRGLERFSSRGPSDHFPFEVALIETPPWPLIYRDADGWIDLTKTSVKRLEHAPYELRGNWEGSAWGFWYKVSKRWEIASASSRELLSPPYNKPTMVRRTRHCEVPREWLHGPPAKPETREERLEKEVAELKAKLTRAAEALGEGGGE